MNNSVELQSDHIWKDNDILTTVLNGATLTTLRTELLSDHIWEDNDVPNAV